MTDSADEKRDGPPTLLDLCAAKTVLALINAILDEDEAEREKRGEESRT